MKKQISEKALLIILKRGKCKNAKMRNFKIFIKDISRIFVLFFFIFFNPIDTLKFPLLIRRDIY